MRQSSTSSVSGTRRRQRLWINACSRVAARFAPTDPIDAIRWLFESRPLLPEGQATDWHAHEKLVEERRDAAVAEVYRALGLDGVAGLARTVESPENVGAALARVKVGTAEEMNDLLREHLATEGPLSAVAHAYALTEARMDLGSLEQRLAADGWTSAQRARFFLFLPDGKATRERVEAEGSEVRREYWRRMHPYGITEDDAEYVTEHLLQHGRPFVAVDVVGFHLRRKRPLPSDLLLRTLERALLGEPNDDAPGQLFTHSASEILTALESDETERSRVAQLEWQLLPALGRYIRSPKVLHLELARDPSFFVQILSFVYPGKNDEPGEPSEDDRVRARQAWELLDTWRSVPGTQPDGSIDGAQLRAWIDEVRERAGAVDRSSIADDVIGHMLVGADEHDGLWPPAPICELIDSLGSEPLDDGFEVAIMNTRGGFTKDLREGGRQELALAEKYENLALKLRDRWPHTASIFDSVAVSYKQHARRADEEAELRTDLEIRARGGF